MFQLSPCPMLQRLVFASSTFFLAGLQSPRESCCPAASRERSWNSPLRLCSFLFHSYSPSLCRPPPDNAVTTCSIMQPQPGWRMCGSTTVKELVDVWQWGCTDYESSCSCALALLPHGQTNVTLIPSLWHVSSCFLLFRYWIASPCTKTFK